MSRDFVNVYLLVVEKFLINKEKEKNTFKETFFFKH